MKYFDYMDEPCSNTAQNIERQIDVQGYVIISKLTGKRWGSCFDSKTGAKTSWYGEFVRRTGYPPNDTKHLKGLKFDEQDEYIIVPLVLAQ